ncbi:hypothetical protein [Spiroplasma endosymbiont of Apeira syringaria]|uniref:hypothetical protein n=1 Tax=Spiroplasma endosymbiont of Apeira syringaria TaxID=3066307 RepID=UPI0030D218D2
MQDIAVQFEKHCWIHSVSLFPPQVHVGRSPNFNYKLVILLVEKLGLLSIGKCCSWLIDFVNSSVHLVTFGWVTLYWTLIT